MHMQHMYTTSSCFVLAATLILFHLLVSPSLPFIGLLFFFLILVFHGTSIGLHFGNVSFYSSVAFSSVHSVVMFYFCSTFADIILPCCFSTFSSYHLYSS